MFPQGDGKTSISWYWLTLSDYYIKLGDVTLFESSAELLRKYPQARTPYLDYQYAFFLQDFFEKLPSIATPIPPDVFCYIDTAEKDENLQQNLFDWYGGIEETTEEEDDIYENVCELWRSNVLDTAILAQRIQYAYYRLDDTIKIRYDFRAFEEDGTPVWSAGCGEYELPYSDFIRDVEDLLVRFFRDMDKQVENAIQVLRNDEQYVAYDILIANEGKDYSTELGIDYLIKDHAERKEEFWDILYAVKNQTRTNTVDWELVKSSVNFLLSQKR